MRFMAKRKNKTKVIFVRVSPEDHAQIENQAQDAGLPLSTFCRLALTRPLPKAKRRGAA